MRGWQLVCSSCGAGAAVETLRWCCAACGGLLDLAGPVADPTPPPGAPWSLWRYAAALPPLTPVSLGEGMTPLVALADGVLAKLEFTMPTLSFKDRGATVLMSAVAASSATSVVVDSSGNAGTAAAAYAAACGVAARVFVPASTSPAKVATIRRFGASVEVVDGDRAATAAAAQAAVASGGAVYASHVHQPLFTAGTATFAYEVWEQMGRRAPATVVLPVGNGTLVLGASHGFSTLLRAGLIDRMPVVVGVQAANCAPIAGVAPSGPTVAEGIAISSPPRLEQVRAAVDRWLLAPESAITSARVDLGRRGLDVEPTAAATWAALAAGPELERPLVLALCGAGLKTP